MQQNTINGKPFAMKLNNRAVFILFFVLLACLSAFGKKGDISKILPPKGKMVENVIYKKTPVGAQLLDVYFPDSTRLGAPRPVVVFIHGGSWMHGSKDEITKSYQAKLLKRLLEDGYVVVSINYRLVNDTMTVIYPSPLADCKDAVKWVKANAKGLNFNPERIAVMGTSAGGHLALMTAYAPDSMADDSRDFGKFSARVKCVVDIYGPTQMAKMLFPTLTPTAVALMSVIRSAKAIKMRSILLWSFTGESDAHPWKRRSKCLYYSPVSYVGTAVPTIIFHGDKDKTVPYAQTELLEKKMKEAGKKVEVYKLQGEDHTFPTITEAATQTICDRLSHFLKENL